MAWRLWLGVVLLAVAACVSGPDPEVDVASDVAPDLPVSTTEKVAVVAPPEGVAIDVLKSPEAPAGRWVEQLGIFGYRTRPSTSADGLEVPDLQSQFPETAVTVVDVNWGIDSSAVLVAADANADTIVRAKEWLGDTTTWVLAGDRWLVALYKGGLAAPFEIDTLSEVVSWVMAPETACDVSDQACPAGRDVGFPPPPPSLVVNATASADMPFDVVELSASTIGTDAVTVTWVEGGEVFTSWGNPGDRQGAENRGAATIAYIFGSFVFLVTPQADVGSTVELRPCCEQTASSAWSVPPGWKVQGLTVTGNFGQEDYQLVIVADLNDDTSTAVAIPLDERFFDPSPAVMPAAAVEALPKLNPPDRRWSLPQRSNGGGLVIVEQRLDGWYLIDDALNDRRELLRSSHPILDYSVAPGSVHVALVIDGPDGPSNWWINGADASQIDGRATSLGWFGTHTISTVDTTE